LSVVGIGASAGGLEALKEFLTAMPADSGMVFVVVQHLEPSHESRMAEILAKNTTMKVVQAADGMPVEPDTVFTNPPGRALSIRDGRFVLDQPAERRHVAAAIDHFLTSLADERGSKAIAIILSGSSGLDGPRGVRAIRAGVMVQDPSTAQFPAMPQAAIDIALVDYVLPPAQMPAVLVEFAQHPQLLPSDREEPLSESTAGHLEAILKLMRTRTNSDYRHYKPATVLRRIQRRMGLRQVGSMGEYIALLQKDAHEVSLLARDMLIGVSSFFRDADAFEELRTAVIVPLVQSKQDDAPLRVWVPGCATGEEAYSIAMFLLEARSAAGKTGPVQVFATDVDEQALETARSGVYPASIAADVPARRLEAFFTKQGEAYRVEKHLREAVVFSRHNLLADPPFSRLDLVSCRNVLIYIEPAAQKRSRSRRIRRRANICTSWGTDNGISRNCAVCCRTSYPRTSPSMTSAWITFSSRSAVR
jgi:two-component system CheB/CheR fusion protein